MRLLIKNWKNFARDLRGATAIEYAMIATLVAVVIFAAMGATGTSVETTYTAVLEAILASTN